MSSSVLIVDRVLNGDNYAISISFKMMKELKLNQNSYVLVTGNESKRIVCQVHKNDGKIDKALLNRINRHNLGICVNDAVTIQPLKDISVGIEVTVALMNCDDNSGLSKETFKELLMQHFKKGRKILHENNKFVVRGGMKALEFVVISILPKPYCIVDLDMTSIKFLNQVIRYKENVKPLSDISYDEIGGCSGLLQNIRSTMEVPLRFPSAFMSLNVEVPKAIFYGPHGCGKALVAQAIATETRANFIRINEKNTSGTLDERVSKIKLMFQKACAYAPSVLCIDDFDYFLPQECTTDESQTIASALLEQIIELSSAQFAVILIGIASDIKNVHPKACELFKNTNTIDKRFKFRIPDVSGRIQILMIHTRNLNLANDFSITDLATSTADFTPAKLAYLCKKVAVRNKVLYNISTKNHDDNDESYLLFKQCLTNDDFKACLKDKEFRK